MFHLLHLDIQSKWKVSREQMVNQRGERESERNIPRNHHFIQNVIISTSLSYCLLCLGLDE